MIVAVVQEVSFRAGKGHVYPGTYHGILGKDSVGWTDEGELVDVLCIIQVREELLHGYTYVEDLAVIILVSIIAIHPTITTEGVDNIPPDVGGIMYQSVDERRKVALGPDESSSRRGAADDGGDDGLRVEQSGLPRVGQGRPWHPAPSHEQRCDRCTTQHLAPCCSSPCSLISTLSRPPR